MKRLLTICAVAGLVLAVTGMTQAGDSSVPADFPTIQAAIDAAGTVAGDTIFVAAGTNTEPAVRITKSVTIQGAGGGVTFIHTTGTIGFYVDTDNVTIKDMTIENGSQAVRFEKAGGTIDNTTLEGVDFYNNSARGIEIHNATTVTNLVVDQCNFEDTNIGLRIASSGHLDGAEFRDSLFVNNFIGIYEANDGSTSTMKNVLITGCTFTNHSGYAIFLEEIQNAMIEYNEFTNNYRDIQIFKWYQASVPVSNVTITNNTMTGTTNAVFAIFNAEHSSGRTVFNGVSFTNNTATDIGRRAVYAGAHSSAAPPSLGGLGWDTVHINCNSFLGIPGNEGVYFYDPDLYPDADDQSLGGASIDVTRNWWGTADALAVESMMQVPAITDFLPILSSAKGCLTIDVGLDIKPGSYPNSLNSDGHGVIPVAILGSADFDVSQIDVTTLTFAGLVVRVKGKGTPQCSEEDVSGDFSGGPEGAPDGYLDLVCQFVDDPTLWQPGDGEATVMGELLDGTPIAGTDTISLKQ